VLRLYALLLTIGLLACGCGTTKWSDSPRTATEQLLISDAIDRAVSEIDFAALEDRSVYLDTRYIVTTLDQNYLISTLRQHMLASGCIIKDKPEEADYVVEVRTGSLGTNRSDVLLGVPATNLPTAGLLPMGSASIPEIALSKRTNQQGVCKIAVFAYDRMSGRPVWQSGNRKVASRAKDTWLLGTGPFQRGNIYDGTAFAGEKLRVPLVKSKSSTPPPNSSVGMERRFPNQSKQPAHGDVQQAGFDAPSPAESAPRPLPPTSGAPPAEVPPSAAPSNAPPSAAPARPKAAYTPPPAPAAATQVPAGQGPQGSLAQQPVFPPTANPAAATAGAIQTYNLAKELMGRREAEP
jgi:hypothetical protein